MQVGHHLLMLTPHAILNMINPLLEVLKLRSEPNLMLVYHILHRIEASVTNNCELLHVSTKRADLS